MSAPCACSASRATAPTAARAPSQGLRCPRATAPPRTGARAATRTWCSNRSPSRSGVRWARCSSSACTSAAAARARHITSSSATASPPTAPSPAACAVASSPARSTTARASGTPCVRAWRPHNTSSSAAWPVGRVTLRRMCWRRCYLDQKDIESGVDWEVSFRSGLHRSCLFVPLVSTAAHKPIEDVSMFDDRADNVLLEIETALQLHRRKRIGVLPLLVGTHGADNTYTPFDAFDVSRFPNGPSTTYKKHSVRDTMRQLFKFQGIFVPPTDVDDDVVDSILYGLSYLARRCACLSQEGWAHSRLRHRFYFED
eukprot:m.1487200 g.1487200  ORF g.1487200 m.1487200 type:complete len:313 (+) comp25185_c1_seq7:3752-4690(+)